MAPYNGRGAGREPGLLGAVRRFPGFAIKGLACACDRRYRELAISAGFFAVRGRSSRRCLSVIVRAGPGLRRAVVFLALVYSPTREHGAHGTRRKFESGDESSASWALASASPAWIASGFRRPCLARRAVAVSMTLRSKSTTMSSPGSLEELIEGSSRWCQGHVGCHPAFRLSAETASPARCRRRAGRPVGSLHRFQSASGCAG